MTKSPSWLLWASGAGLLLFAILLARPGVFTIDEVIYLFAADSFRLTGSLSLDNGWNLAASRDLRWTDLLTLGPNGLTSQYPVGSAVVWAPLISLLGVKGAIYLNTLATVLAVFAVHALAMQSLQDRAAARFAALLFLFGTFALEYAFGYWPHAISVLTVTASLLYLMKALESEGRAFHLAAIAGLILGVGLLFRLDTVLCLPAFAAIALLFAARPFAVACGGVIGTLPAFAILALTNFEKFGSYNPLSYGGKSGTTNLAGYLPFMLLLVAGFLALLAWRFRRPANPRPWLVALAALAALAVIALPPLRNIALQWASGAFDLLIDSRGIEPGRGDVQRLADGTTAFWGLPKKAMAQSLPWLGILVLLFSPTAWKKSPRTFAIFLLFAAIFTFPFLIRSWHGGLSLNMRYFLPLTPLLSVMGAALILDLGKEFSNAKRLLLWSGIFGFLVSALWTILLPSSIAGAHQILSLYLFAFLAVLAFAAIFAKQALARPLFLVSGLAIGISVFNTLTDTALAQLRREGRGVLVDFDSRYDGKVLIYETMLRSALLDPDQIVAISQPSRGGADVALVEAALQNGYRVLMPDLMAEAFANAHPHLTWEDVEGPVDLAEVRRKR